MNTKLASSISGHRTAPPLPAVARRRRPGVVVLAILALAVGALLNLMLLGSGDRQRVLAVVRAVPLGAPIGDADLRVVEVPPADGLTPIREDEQPGVLGKFAAVALRPGTLLVRADLSDQQLPGPGRVLVALAVRPEQIPARGLVPGDQLLVVDGPADQQNPASTGSGGAAASGTRAVVAGVGPADADDSVTVDVTVAASDGPGLARLAATGRAALVLLPAGS